MEVIDIVAINVRTEINYGLFSDGCTALAWKTDTSSFLAQNWDVSLSPLTLVSGPPIRDFPGHRVIS